MREYYVFDRQVGFEKGPYPFPAEDDEWAVHCDRYGFSCEVEIGEDSALGSLRIYRRDDPLLWLVWPWGMDRPLTLVGCKNTPDMLMFLREYIYPLMRMIQGEHMAYAMEEFRGILLDGETGLEAAQRHHDRVRREIED